jgi:3-oxoacyl-[acyl-carrier protein] reductase
MSETQPKVAVVTGASRGIGRAIACELAAQGCIVVVNYADREDAAQRTVDAVRALGAYGMAFKADVRDPVQIERLFAAVAERFGRLDILVNNAGVSATGLFGKMSAADLDHAIDVNIKGAIFTTQRAAAALGERGGAVVNIGSTLVAQPVATQAVYASTKGAVETLTRALAQELGPLKIRVNAVAPGPIETDMLQIDGETRGYLTQRTALGRLGQPQDIAKVVAFLAGDAAAWITGQVIGVDGGLRL